jgi:hypothetical protein
MPVANGHLPSVLRFDLPARRFSCDSPVIAGTLHDIVPLIAPLLPFMSAERIAEA